ncbi:MAG: hypothetical protein AAFO69_05445 [Bacteroidota bacterium]
MSNLRLNKQPISIAGDSSVESNTRADGYNVITVAPTSNRSTSAEISGAREGLQSVALPEGTKVCYPFVGDFNNNFITVSNTDSNNALKAGWYALSSEPGYVLSGNSQSFDQYESIGTQASASRQTLRLSVKPGNVTMAILIVGNQKPVPVYFNITEEELKDAGIDYPDNAEFPDQTYVSRKNFMGQTIYIVNVSMIAGSLITASLN